MASNKDSKDLKDLIESLNEAEAYDEPRCFCVVESEWERLWNKTTPSVGTRIFVVADFNELPKNFMDWYRITYTAPFYYEFDGKEWNKIKA